MSWVITHRKRIMAGLGEGWTKAKAKIQAGRFRGTGKHRIKGIRILDIRKVLKKRA